MPKTNNIAESRIIAGPNRLRSSHSRKIPADLMAKLSSPNSASQPRRPENRGDPLGMKLLKQKLFPRRGQPVQIGRFNVLRLIGHGGMGAVYACYDEVLDRKVAVKILHLDSSRDRELASSRLVREGQALARLSHPNVVTVHEVGRSEKEVFVAMEFLRGDSLDVWVAQPRSWREILDVFMQAGRGIVAAHRVGIVHRDFKPQNVLVSEDNLVKVLDFGLARASGEEVHEGLFESVPDGLDAAAATSSSELLRPLTVTGALVGTPAYMSPEQYRGELVTAASDQFSFCVSLYQCLYGVLPFSTRSLAELRADVLAGRVSPAPLRSQVPSRIYRSLRRGMSAKPADRYRSMKELLADLDWHKAARKTWVGVAVASTVLAGFAGFMTADAAAPVVEICPDAGAELAGVWDDAERELVTAAITSIDAPQVDDVLAIALPYLDHYADAWVDMRDEACHTHAEGRQADGLFDRRMACLDQRRASLDALVEVFATATQPGHLNSLSQATFALPSLDRCGDADALLAELAPPENPELRAQVQTHRENLARASMLNFAGELPQALEIVEAISRDAEAMEYPPLVAEVDQQLGYLQWHNNDIKAAEKSLERAMLTGVRTGHRSVAAQASSRLAFLRATSLHKLDRIAMDLPLVEALNDRIKHDVDLYAEYLNNTGWVRVLSGERQKGEALLVAADDLRKKHGRAQTPLALGTLSNLGYLAQNDGQFEKMEHAFRTLATRSLKLFGPMAPTTIEAENAVGGSLHELGRPREAIRQLQSLLQKANTLQSNVTQAQVRYKLADSEFKEGNFSTASEHLIASLALIPVEKDGYDLYLHQRMRAFAASGDEAAMLDDYHQAKQRLETFPDPVGYRRSMLLYHYGLALADLGRPEDALVPLEEARSGLPAEVIAVEPLVAPRLSLALGQVYRNAGKLEAAQSALDQALLEFGEGWTILRADTHQELGLLAMQRAQPELAIHELNDANALYATTAERTYLPWARTRFSLAKALTQMLGNPSEEARMHALAAEDVFRNSGKTELADEVASWLDDHS